MLAEEIDRLEALAKGDRDVTGTPSGFRDLDNLLGGFQPGNLIVLAARPSAVGKSALVCNIAENVATKARLPVAFFSLEMSEAELAHRFIGCRARIPSDRCARARWRHSDWPRGRPRLQRAGEGAAVARRLLRPQPARAAGQGAPPGRQERGLGLVIVDYMQLMRPEDPRANRVEQVGQISRGLKILARELKLPVIGVSQLSRAPGAAAATSGRSSRTFASRADRAGRGRRRLHLPEDSKYDEDADPSGARRPDRRQAPQRAHGDVQVVFLEQYPASWTGRGAERPVEQKAGEGPPLIDWPRRRADARPVRLAGADDAAQPACPLGVCDGSGWILGPEDVARPCECRERRMARRRARGVASVIPRKYRGVSLDRPPISGHGARPAQAPVTRRSRSSSSRSTSGSTGGAGCGSMGDVGTGKTTLAMLVSKAAVEAGARSRSTRCRVLLARIRRTYDAEAGEQSYLEFFERLTSVDLLHVDDLGVEKRSDWVLEQLYAIVNERYEAQRSMVVTTNLDQAALEEQIGPRPSPAWSRSAATRCRCSATTCVTGGGLSTTTRGEASEIG